MRSVILAADCLQKKSGFGNGTAVSASWATDALVQACWLSNPVRAGYCFERPAILPDENRAKLLKARKNRRTALEIGYLVRNWTLAETKSLYAERDGDAHHVLGIANTPAKELTKLRLNRIAKIANERFFSSNPWAAQADRIVEREDLPPLSRREFINFCPYILSNQVVRIEELAEVLDERDTQSVHGPSLHEAAAANPNITDEEAAAFIESFDASRGDRLSIAGMRRLVSLRGSQPSVVDACSLAIVRLAERGWPRAELALRELVEAPAFGVSHYDYLAVSMQRFGRAPSVLGAWSGARDSDIASWVNSSDQSEQIAAANYGLQNPNLPEALQLRLVQAIGNPAAVEGWLLCHPEKLSEFLLKSLLEHVVGYLGPERLGAMMALPGFAASVVVQLMDLHPSKIHECGGCTPSALAVMLAEREHVEEEIAQ